MDILSKITVHLSKEEVSKLINDHLRVKFPDRQVKTVDWKISNTSDDRFGGMPSLDVTSVDVTLVPKEPR